MRTLRPVYFRIVAAMLPFIFLFSSLAKAAIRGPGKYAGIVIFDRYEFSPDTAAVSMKFVHSPATG